MRTWVRATGETLCGLCPRHIMAGDPMVIIEVPGITMKRYRCQTCSGGAPPDLPPHVPRELPTFKPFVHITTGADALPLDFKHGEREPGQEG